MKRSWPIPVMVLLLLAGLGGSRAAHSDDWPQFRRDSSRSAASLDRIKLPLTEIWSWTTAAEFTRHSPLFHASVWRDRVFFVAADGNTRYLVCANAKTGAVIWRQAMAARRMPSNHTNTVGPVVSKDGVVFVYDHAPILQFNAAAPTFWARGGPEVTRRYQYGSAERNQREWEKQERSSLLGEKLLNNVIPVARNYLAASGLLPTGPLRWSRVVNGVTVERRGKFVSFFQSVAIPSPNAREGEPREAEVVTASLSFDVENAYVVRTFAAANGTPGPVAPLPKTWFEMDVNYLVLHHPPLSHEVRAHRDTLINMGRNYDSNQGGPGYPLLAGNEFAATRGENFFFRWKPLANGIEALPRPTVVDHPLPVPAPFVSEGARFAGFPPVLFSGGFLVGDDMGHRFLTPIDMAATDARSRHWHLDLQNTVGVPASDGKTIYVSLGGPGASRAITAIDGGTGTPFWRYAPGGLSPDPVRREPRDHNPPPPGYFPSRESNVRGMLLPFAGQQVFSLTRPGHWSNPGLVVSGGRIYGEVNGAIVALDQSTGAVVWRHVLPRNAMVRSLVATPDHLLACISPAERTQLAAIVSIDDNGGGHEGNVGLNGRPGVWETIHDDANTLLALRREDGKPVWQDVSLRPGNLSLAGGMVFYANGGLHALGPPERTFRLAIDSTRAEDYAQTTEAAPGEDEAPAAAPEPPAPDAVAPPPAPQKPDPALADATVLRLAWGQPLPQMLEQLRLRREAAPGLPLLLSLDRLNPHRSAWTDAAAHPPFTPEWRAEYAAACRELATARPEYFEILPEINVYLTHAPKQRASVTALVQALAREIHAVSPTTRVVVSFNVEVLAGTYGRGAYRPFGELVLPRKAVPLESLAVAAAADAVGLTSHPQSALKLPTQVPPDYLLSFRKVLGERPLLVTKLAVRPDEKLGPARVVQDVQATWLRRLLQNCYWLDAAVVAYPDLVTEEAGRAASPVALRVGAEARLGLGVWRNVFEWRRVGRLTLAAQRDPDAEPAPQEAGH